MLSINLPALMQHTQVGVNPFYLFTFFNRYGKNIVIVIIIFAHSSLVVIWFCDSPWSKVKHKMG